MCVCKVQELKVIKNIRVKLKQIHLKCTSDFPQENVSKDVLLSSHKRLSGWPIDDTPCDLKILSVDQKRTFLKFYD